MKLLLYISTIIILGGLISCEDVLFEEDISEDIVFTLAPSENTVLSDSIVNFSWNTIEDATEYQFQIATPNFTTSSQIVINTTVVDTINSNSQQISVVLANGDYEWRVRAFNGSSQTVYSTIPFSVEVETFEEDISDSTVSLIAPSDEAVLETSEINFNWEEVEFAEEYTLQIATPDFDNPLQVVVNTTLGETSSTHDLENGTYQWRVKAQNSTSETPYSINSFSVEAVVFNEDISGSTVSIIAPPEGTILNAPEINFTWDAVEFAEEYQFQIATPNFTNPTQVVVDEIVTSTTSMHSLEDGSYQWRIKAINSTSQTPFTTTSFSVAIENNDDISSQTVMLIAPTDGSEITTNDINFTWQAVNNAEEYILQIATPNFTSPTQVIVDEVLSQTSSMQNIPDGQYQWRVKARNSTSETPFTTYSFTVSTQSSFPDRVVFILSPANNFVSNQSNLNIQWQEVEDATLYRIQVLDASNNVLDEETTSSTNIPFTFPEGELIWQVRAETTSENTQYTSQNITIDSRAPNTPELLTPTDTEVVNSTSVTFTWNRTPINGTTEQDVLYIYDDPALTNLVLQEIVSGGSFTTTLADDTTYYWFMNANDSAGNVSPDSDVFSFSIDE